ncbi:MAG TPA: glycine betaine ABC transporter substrate-binding protein [Terriglobales bacterium]|nr:glycine betaine ABC transporter substrate-binding protein [Terriglobales bacterium]
MIFKKLAAPIVCALIVCSSCMPQHHDRIVVASKNFTEQAILGEILAQYIEYRTKVPVERRFYLAGTYVCHQALLAGRADVYPEYTGTALTAILEEKPSGNEANVFQRVKSEYAQRFKLDVMPSLGFNNTFAVIIRGEDARRLHIHTLSEAGKYSPQWRAAFGYEFMERPDGYAGLARVYNLHFAQPPKAMDLGLLYRAIKDHQVDLIVGNSTDGLIQALNLVVLQDDRHYFPPYDAVPIVRQDTIRRFPLLKTALDDLAGKISEDEMRKMNYAVDGERRDTPVVAREFLKSKGLLQ